LKKFPNQLLVVGILSFIGPIACRSTFAQIAPRSGSNSIDWTQASREFVSTRELAASSPRVDLLEVPPSDDPQATSTQQQRGFVVRNLRRGLADQKNLYAAPFKVKNLKWDALFLGVTAGLIAGDRHVSRQISNDHVDVSHAVALGTLLGTSAAAGGIWAYGLKTGDKHADETGELTLETLANTFLIYTPMQFLAGRERPDEAAGNGRFWVHRNFNTSFPAGHPMFTWAMASVIAHEYPRTWVKILAYGAASTLTVSRLTGRNHFTSDLWVGSALGYLIGAKIFHDRCDPQFSEACHR
jgi:membrane-associated phospholipid phosphatase